MCFQLNELLDRRLLFGTDLHSIVNSHDLRGAARLEVVGTFRNFGEEQK